VAIIKSKEYIYLSHKEEGEPKTPVGLLMLAYLSSVNW
jgi:hypothetical protein